MYAIFGLGNVGTEYANTYHNMGFMTVDAFAKKHNLVFTKTKFNAFVAEGEVNGQKVMLFKPTTLMNNSGISVSQVYNMYKLSPNQVLVIYDDVDIPVGQIRLRQSGSAGSHNGMKSVIASIGTSDFPRLRIGTGDSYDDLINYVLSPLRKDKIPQINQSIEHAVETIDKFLEVNGEVNRVQI